MSGNRDCRLQHALVHSYCLV